MVRGSGPGELRLAARALGKPGVQRTVRLVAPSEGWEPISLVLAVPAGTDRLDVELIASGPFELDQLRLAESSKEQLQAVSAAAEVQSLSDEIFASAPGLEREQLLVDWAVHPEAHAILLGSGFDQTTAELGAEFDRELWRAMGRVQSPQLLKEPPQALVQPRTEADALALERVAREYPLRAVYAKLLAPQLQRGALPAAQDAAMRVLADAGDARFFAAFESVYLGAALERRAALLDAAASIRDTQALETLAKRVRSARGLERELAERAFLHAARSASDLEGRAWLLDTGLAHRDSYVRRASLLALGQELEPVEISAILRLTRDSDPEVLRTLIPVLAAHPSDASSRALQDLVGHRRPEVAADALRGLWAQRSGDSGVRSFARGVIVGEGQWAVQQAAIELLARDERNLPPQRLRQLAVSSADWRVARAATRVLIARGEQAPEGARTAPEQGQTLVVIALDREAIAAGDPTAVAPWLQLREWLTQDALQAKLWLAGVPPQAWRESGFASGAERLTAFDRWFAERPVPVGIGSMGGLREALRKACAEQDGVELVLAIDADLRDGELEDWLDLAADFRRWNAHQQLKLRVLTAPDGGRLSLALSEFAAD